MASSEMVVDIHVIKILLPIAGCKMVAAEICQTVAISEFVDQMQEIHSLEVIFVHYNSIVNNLTLSLAAPASHFKSTT